ncbi:uncharacterized protein LOC110111890 [Dendrobium catenatum]|uniref:uncharacterized protein LOC110111890 n=1 Tax=Dendrobium catenatum TaxID=906689 RepID=UPI0009F64379|nr:uncharacterized protein LOC110111890 [Dendrobium catenatum]
MESPIPSIKAYWDIIKKDFWNAINKFLETGCMDPNWKETLIVLIPKLSNPLVPSNFRPISLCKIVYKVATKVIMNRLSSIIPKLISEEQAAFFEGISLSDHVLVAQELTHKLRFSKSSKGFISLKNDIEQAYDSMGWPTSEKALEYFGFSSKFSKLILECVQEPKFSILINGNYSSWINARSGF